MLADRYSCPSAHACALGFCFRKCKKLKCVKQQMLMAYPATRESRNRQALQQVMQHHRQRLASLSCASIYSHSPLTKGVLFMKVQLSNYNLKVHHAIKETVVNSDDFTRGAWDLRGLLEDVKDKWAKFWTFLTQQTERWEMCAQELMDPHRTCHYIL